MLLGVEAGVDEGLDAGVEVALDEGLVSTWLGEEVLLVRVDVHAPTTRATADISPITAERPLILQREV